MTSTTTHPFGHICNAKTGDIIRIARRGDWSRAKEHGEPSTGAHLDIDGETVVFCDGPDEDPAGPTPTPFDLHGGTSETWHLERTGVFPGATWTIRTILPAEGMTPGAITVLTVRPPHYARRIVEIDDAAWERLHSAEPAVIGTTRRWICSVINTAGLEYPNAEYWRFARRGEFVSLFDEWTIQHDTRIEPRAEHPGLPRQTGPEIVAVAELLRLDVIDQTWCVDLYPILVIHGWDEHANLPPGTEIETAARLLHAVGWRAGMTIGDAIERLKVKP